MPIKVQIALQGGGAKLASLLAVLEALAICEQEGKIQITRIAGTSAGAIAGSLFAVIPKPDRIKGIKILRTQLLGERGVEIAKKLKMPWDTKLVWDGYWGNEAWAEGKEKIREWLSEHLGAKTFQDLKNKEVYGSDAIDLQIVSAELSAKQKKTYSSSDSVLTAVLQSCGLPFLFSTWRQGESVVVDGGFCENLPITELSLNASTDGVVIAVTFNRQAPKPPSCVKTFSLALLDVAIEHSVQRARHAIQDAGHIIELNPEIETFDFKKAFNQNYLHTYNDLKDEVVKSLNKIVAEEEDDGVEEKKAEIHSNYWTDANKHLIDTMRRVGKVYQQIFRLKTFRYEKITFQVWVDRWKDSSLPCKLRLKLIFIPTQSEIECTSIQLTAFDPTIDAITSLTLIDGQGKPVGLTCVPMRIEESPNSRSVAAFYDSPLKAENGPYAQTYFDHSYLTPEQLYDFTFTADRPDGSIKNIELVLHIPKNKKGVDLVQKESLPPGRKMTPKELEPYNSDPDYYTVGWTGENITLKPDEKFGANIVAPIA